ncbi:anti-sigma factor domain-containing protein [Brevibacillus massiliensis]|uniref:anti-sigma factor domain-containing protein n=1 Tax=Brevibacillus massiliensis TaxID=1118054 RepID=UPI0002D55F40|nr:anti-sigma factor [Brevibacillus massiliensis]
MSNKHCGWLEEEIVDFVLGRLAPGKQEHLSRHLPECERCGAVHRDWTGMLSDRKEQPMPSPALKRRLRRSVYAAKGAALFSRLLRMRVLVPAAGLIALTLLSALLLSENGKGRYTLPELDEGQYALQERTMIMDPRTVVHVLAPVSQEDAKGYVWVNDSSNELLFLANGLDRMEEKDYQVWFIMENGRSNVGVLQWNGGIARLYFQGEEVRRVQNISVSIEPKGGSFVPTGPETIHLKVTHAKE